MLMWEAGREEVMDHILSLNEDKYDLVSQFPLGNDSV